MRRVAIAGAGIGARHAEGYAALPGRFAVAAICDLDEARGRPLAEAHGAAYHPDLDAALADPDVDIVDICLPPGLHCSHAARALEAGKDVVCEKPLATSLREADRLAATAEETGRRVFPVFQYRYGPGMAQLRALVGAGLAGRCHSATLETHWSRDAEYYSVDWRGTWAGERGGAVLGHAIHVHDLAASVLGPARRVFALADTLVNDIEVEDCAAIAMRTEDGALVTSSVTLGSADNRSRLKLMFEGFTVESDQAPYAPAARPWTFTARAPRRQRDLDAVLAEVPAAAAGYPGLFEAVADALDGDSGREVTLADGRRSVEFVTAVYASAREGRAVNLPLGPDHPLYDGWSPTC